MVTLTSGSTVLRDSVLVLLEASPRGIDADAVGRQLVAYPGVVSVHVLHVWEITSVLPRPHRTRARPPRRRLPTASAANSRRSSTTATASTTPPSRSTTRPRTSSKSRALHHTNTADTATASARSRRSRRVSSRSPVAGIDYRYELRRGDEVLATGHRVWAIEGTGSYGAGLARFLVEHGEAVLEISRTPRTERRLAGRDDALDAVRIARAALASDKLALPRSGERREALRLLLVARRSAVDVRREGLTQLRAVIVTAPESLRDELRRLPLGRLLDRCSRLGRTTARADELAVRLVLRSLARRVQAATVEADQLEREILAHVRAIAPALLDEPGVGPIVAAQLIVAATRLLKGYLARHLYRLLENQPLMA